MQAELERLWSGRNKLSPDEYLKSGTAAVKMVTYYRLAVVWGGG